MIKGSTLRQSFKLLRVVIVAGMLLGLLTPIVQVTPAYAASVSSMSFSGTTGTASVSGTLYARNGAALTLTVSTDANTQCVEIYDSSNVLIATQNSTTNRA